jgi:hypothetical protein
MIAPLVEPSAKADRSYLAVVQLDGETYITDGPAELSAAEIALAILAGARDSCAAHVKVEVVITR